MPTDRSYDGDLVLWAEDQARALRDAARARINLPIDWQNVAEEIEALGKSQRRELASRIRTVLVHLMKLQASPATEPHAGWRATIRRERAEIETLLRDSPSLGPTIPAVIVSESATASRIATADLADFGEPPKTDLAQTQYEPEQVLGDWFPA
jgi:branched-subunit amino acid aminotransferase/4-amino-4-deoxychorismate lyase